MTISIDWPAKSIVKLSISSSGSDSARLGEKVLTLSCKQQLPSPELSHVMQLSKVCSVLRSRLVLTPKSDLASRHRLGQWRLY
ncbi:hypothetical protein BO85DRAFT_176804 [Aspergillus piperis CBS 112811]|uniref:Uncharacterized protein n=1 Tax=Aspergillus piperis CBS 112811 TaxID=1448313 RepID=A0A8G1QSC7_9EURO|nr:hypothetical protein BO85DRAFT_176804 [Aspergillus piperis CBS 112811]RAH52743.1 hypothetical protein BO85DRAFT_176804 [Aspergillus piperis CBS 112811]